MSDVSEQALARRASSGDPIAIAELLELNLPKLRTYIRLRSGRFLRALESSSDLAQSVCREVLADLVEGEYPGDRGFRAWLFLTARRKIADRVRYYRAEKRDAGRLVSSPSKADIEQIADGYARAGLGTPSRAAMTAERVAQIEAAMDRLTPGDRDLIAQRRVLGMTYAEIAERMGKSEGAVRVQLHRALSRLSCHLPDLD